METQNCGKLSYGETNRSVYKCVHVHVCVCARAHARAHETRGVPVCRRRQGLARTKEGGKKGQDRGMNAGKRRIIEAGGNFVEEEEDGLKLGSKVASFLAGKYILSQSFSESQDIYIYIHS